MLLLTFRRRHSFSSVLKFLETIGYNYDDYRLSSHVLLHKQRLKWMRRVHLERLKNQRNRFGRPLPTFDVDPSRYPLLNAVFSESDHQVLFVETGGALYNILGLSVGAGLIRENGFLLGADGSISTQEVRLSVIPFQASGLFRLDVFEDQVLVPFATAGLDYWVWQEKWTNGTVEDQMSGGKMGYHYSFGIILLEIG